MIAPKRVAHTAGRDKKVGASLRTAFAVAMGTAEQRKEALLLGARCDDYWKGQCFLDDKKYIF